MFKFLVVKADNIYEHTGNFIKEMSIIQKSVNIRTMQTEELRVEGRHDPCIVPRAVPVIEAVAAISIADFIL